MIKSMTGFASLTREDEQAVVNVTVRTVNHRYLDVQVRLPPALNEIEGRLRALVQQSVARGRVEITVSVQQRQPPPPIVELNEGFVAALESALERARTRGIVTGHLSPGDLLRLPQALTIRDQPGAVGDGHDLARGAERAVGEALAALEGMRVHEGEHLARDLEARRGGLATLLDGIAAAAADGQRDLQQRLAARIAELTADLQFDRAAVAQEVVRMAGRSDISEELTRFRAHLAHWRRLAGAREPCGRKLDFLLQEMNREINTIASKADGQSVSELVVTVKAELERMREQAQNIL